MSYNNDIFNFVNNNKQLWAKIIVNHVSLYNFLMLYHLTMKFGILVQYTIISKLQVCKQQTATGK